jgi:O-antigen ligase
MAQIYHSQGSTKGDRVERRQPWRVDANSQKWTSGLILGALAVILGVVAGALMTAINPLYAAAGLVGIFVAAAILMNTQIGLYAFVGVACLLPFGVIPVPLGSVKLTFIDVTLSALLLIWLARLLTTPGTKLQITKTGGFILIFIFLAFVSFVVGTGYGTQAETSRLFLKIINSMLFFFTVINCVKTRQQIDKLIAVFVLAGAGGALLGLIFYVLPAGTSTQLLSSLGSLGYPRTSILRYIADTKTLRATGTAIDPNILGSMLMITSALGINQLLSPRPVIKRTLLIPLVGVMLLCLLLTFSRGSWVGLMAAMLFLALFKYRKLWILFGFVVIAVVLVFSPDQNNFVGHLLSGLQFQDKASAMRLGEYKDALRLIGLYPWFGVGFGDAPSIDLYVGVSSIYLLIAEQMGLIGLASFLLVVGYTLYSGIRTLLADGIVAIQSASDELVERFSTHTHLLGLLAALLSALVAGFADHYFFNLRFPHTVAIFWLLIGLITACILMRQQSEA